MSERADPATFLSGEPGIVIGARLEITRTVADLALTAAAALTFAGPRIDRLAARGEPRRVKIVSIYRPGSRLPRTLARLTSRRHTVFSVLGAIGPVADPALASRTLFTDMSGGKFENLNRLLGVPGGIADWTLVVDDDVDLPRRFVDRFVALIEHFGLDLAQPAQSMRSHAAWSVTRRRADLARRTNFVEIGPVTALSRRVADGLLPFPPLRYGWGLDNHWSALAARSGWSMGVIDALPVRHEWQPVATGYAHADAIEEAARFLADKPYVHTERAQRTEAVLRSLRT